MFFPAAVPQASDLAPIADLWAYLGLALTGIITEEATPLIGGLAAHDGRLDLVVAGLWTAAGVWAADLLLYAVGRTRGRWIRKRWPGVRRFVLRALRVVRRNPWRASLAVRFAYGLRITLPIACGAARLPLWLYTIGSGISSVVWTVLFTAIGWGFGRTTLIILGHVRRYERILVPAIIVGVVIAWWVMRKRHVEEEVVEVIATGHRKSHAHRAPDV